MLVKSTIRTLSQKIATPKRVKRVSKTLLNLKADNMLPSHDNASSLTHEMGEYFVHKISTIRSKLDSHCPSRFYALSNAYQML